MSNSIDILFATSTYKLKPSRFDYYMSQLPTAMQQSIRTFMRWEDAQLALLGKLLLLEAFAKAGLAKKSIGAIQYTAFNRPYLHGQPVDFNISHSGEVVVCAISNQNRIGIDVEKIKPIDAEQFTDQFTPEELTKIRNAADPLREFYNWWTLKEALIKAGGKGLNIPLNGIHFITPLCAEIEGDKWYLQSIAIQEGYCCHVATSSLVETPIEIRQYTFV